MKATQKKMKKRLDRRIKGYTEMVTRSSSGGREYTKPGSMKK